MWFQMLIKDLFHLFVCQQIQLNPFIHLWSPIAFVFLNLVLIVITSCSGRGHFTLTRGRNCYLKITIDIAETNKTTHAAATSVAILSFYLYYLSSHLNSPAQINISLQTESPDVICRCRILIIPFASWNRRNLVFQRQNRWHHFFLALTRQCLLTWL